MIRPSSLFILALAAVSTTAVPLQKRIAQVISASTQKWEAACRAAGGDLQCNPISVAAFTTLLAAAGPCEQQDSGDKMIDFAKQLNKDRPDAAMIKFAQIFVQQPRNTPSSLSVPYCQKAPKNQELIGLFQCQFQGASKDTFVGGVAVGAPGTIPFGQSKPLDPRGSCPAHPDGPITDGTQLVDITQDPGSQNGGGGATTTSEPTSTSNSAPEPTDSDTDTFTDPGSAAATVTVTQSETVTVTVTADPQAAPSTSAAAASPTPSPKGATSSGPPVSPPACAAKKQKRNVSPNMSIAKRIAQADLPAVAQSWQDLCLVSGGDIQTNDPCVRLAGLDGISALLAGADPCAQQDNADNMIDFANSPGINNRQALIDNAVKYRAHPRNALDIGGFTPSTLYCTKAPRNNELNGVVNGQLAGVDPGLFGGPKAPVVAFGAPGTCPFGQTPDVATCSCS